MAHSIMSLRDVRKEFFRKGRDSARYFDAVARFDFDVSAGDLIACTGRSGSGKTTLLNIMAGLLAPTEGTVELDGSNLYTLDDSSLARLRNEHIGVVPQGQTAVHSLTLIQNVMLAQLMYRPSANAEARAFSLLRDLEIADLADSYPRELSGGELRRMAIARALIGQPKLVLADEPTGDLDDASTASVLNALRKVAEEGAAVFMVTHDEQAVKCANRFAHMNAGKLEEVR